MSTPDSEIIAKQGEDFRALFLFLENTTPIQVECSWCGVVMKLGRKPVSHGICAPCAKEWFGFTNLDEAQPEATHAP